MKGNKRKKAFISFYLFFRIGAFQWVTADSNKKTLGPFPPARRPQRAACSDVIPYPFPPTAAPEIRSTETYNTCFGFCQAIAGSHSVSCWHRKFRMLWRRGTGPKRHGRACPGYPRVSAQRTTARSGEAKKALFLRPSRPRAALPGLVSEAARRGWPEQALGQARPGRERLRDESEAARQQLRF
jgi:hypothetical protein